MAEVKTVLVRFLKRCFTNENGGRTMDPGDTARIPESHFHPELHVKLDPATGEPIAPAPAASSAPAEGASVPATASAPAEPTPAAST